jgi:nucleotide-binding universal stress UspA family protein
MGTHGLGGFHKLLLGSTTERLLRRTQTALLAVPLVDSQSVVLDPSGPRFSAKTILAATDFSEASTDAVHCGATLAQSLAAPLLLVHAVTPIAVRSEWLSYLEGVDEERLGEARARLQRLAADLPGKVNVTSST